MPELIGNGLQTSTGYLGHGGITDGTVGVDSRYRQTRTLPTPSEKTFEVTEFELDRRLSIPDALGPVRTEVAYLLAPAENGTIFVNTMSLQPSHPLGFVCTVGGLLRQVGGGRQLRHSQTDPQNSGRPT